ncbi:UV DNA damage repair endonuclease UvsE [Paenibacillus tarimensis]
MIVRLGYVAMSVHVKNASPSKTMTVTNFSKLADRKAAVRKLERIGAENLHNTLRLLRHNAAHEIYIYRLSSKLIPLFGHELLGDWNPTSVLADEFAAVGDYAKKHGMRLSFHPDHFTVLSTPRKDVLISSIADLDRHVRMLEAMGLGLEALCNIHIGGSYGDKPSAQARFVSHFESMEQRVRERVTLENDDKTFTALETLEVCERVGVPMVLDLHHHHVNNDGESAASLWQRIARTWVRSGPTDASAELPPKIHVSSPKNDKVPRRHADYVEPEPLLEFLREIAAETPRLDVMIEAKLKDEALFRLIESLKGHTDIKPLTGASFEVPMPGSQGRFQDE